MREYPHPYPDATSQITLADLTFAQRERGIKREVTKHEKRRI